MSYVKKLLMPGENIVYRAYLHWAVFLRPILWFIAFWLCIAGSFYGSDAVVGVWALIFGALIFVVILPLTALHAFVARRTSEFTVTNKRVLIKTGLIRRHSLETLLSKIESIGVTQGILGRILDFGTIVVSGTGGSKEPFHRIADPSQFQRQVQEQIIEDWRKMHQRSN